MRKDVKEQWERADVYLKHIKRIIQLNAGSIINVEIASEYLDTNNATDMVVSVSGGAKIGVRVRKTNYRDFTIRAYCQGYKTEIDKIKEGFPDFYCYAWVENWVNKMVAWVFLDMKKFRESGLLDEYSDKIKMNKDGITGFIYIPVAKLEKAGCVVSKWGNV